MRVMIKIKVFFICLLSVTIGMGQSPSLSTFMNPVIPGDHPDCTLTRIGKHFYTTGSSFNPTPVIYHSTDLVHWEAIAQPVSAGWALYGNKAAGGCWGGQVVYHHNKYWHFFSHDNQMYFVTADDIRGSWTSPTLMNCPPSVPGLGYDNSIFIDEDGSWYLLVKNGRVNNWILQLGENGQPQGAIYDLTWINPEPDYPFSWAEGPVMWKYNGHYYYCFGLNVGGGEKVFRSDSLTDNRNFWKNLGNFFNESDPLKPQAMFQNPNHNSAVVMLDDSTHWIVHPLWRNVNNNEWYGQGRQGLLNQVYYDDNDKPTADYPVNIPKNAPDLPSSGIPWMVPHSDFFDSEQMSPEWSFSGYTPQNLYSLTDRSGWLRLSPRTRMWNTIIKNDGEHNYSLITRLDFTAGSVYDQAGIWIFDGNQSKFAKLYSSVDSTGSKIIAFSYQSNYYQVFNPAESGQNIVLLKLVRKNHRIFGYYSFDSFEWTQIGNDIDVSDLDGLQPNYNSWTGNRQGLYVQSLSEPAYFDYYIYRDAYTPILAECPANQSGTNALINRYPPNSLGSIHDNDWALYAGVEFGDAEYQKSCDSIRISASSAGAGGVVQVYLDSIDSEAGIAEVLIGDTGSWTIFKDYTAPVPVPVSGNHDVYLKFSGTADTELFQIRAFQFITNSVADAVDRPADGRRPDNFFLGQNYPNPFNPATTIDYSVPTQSHVSLVVYDLLGRKILTLFNGLQKAGRHTAIFDGTALSGGVYLYRLKSENYTMTRKSVLLK